LIHRISRRENELENGLDFGPISSRLFGLDFGPILVPFLGHDSEPVLGRFFRDFFVKVSFFLRKQHSQQNEPFRPFPILKKRCPGALKNVVFAFFFSKSGFFFANRDGPYPSRFSAQNRPKIESKKSA
jgi:hypothetical protein